MNEYIISKKQLFHTSIFLIVAFLLLPSISSYPQVQSSGQQSSLLDQTIAVMHTNMGTIKLAFYDDLAPVTVNNFVELANIGFFDGLVFHRVIDDFMIQGGGYDVNGSYTKSPLGTIDLEIHPNARHVDGAISMARTNDPNSATSQFFICDGPQSFLDDNYAVFGIVIEGIEVIRDIASVETMRKHRMDDWPVEEVVINEVFVFPENTIYVDDDNIDGPWEGSDSFPFRHIQDAVDIAYDYDTVFVYSGIYDENIQLNKAINLNGQDKESTIISASNPSEYLLLDSAHFSSIQNLTFLCNNDERLNIIKTINSNNCTIRNINIVSVTQQRSAIYVEGSDNIIEQVTISGDFLFAGIELLHGNYNIITNNNIESSNSGILVFRSHENIVTSNLITKCSTGIYLEEGNQNHISLNDLVDNGRGMFCSYATKNLIERNNFIENDEQAKFTKLYKIGFLAPNRWAKNYWDDFNGPVKPIPGLMYFPNENLIGLFFPWIEFDWQPISQPN